MAWAVWERRTFCGEDGVLGTTSGASAEVVVMLRVWPSWWVGFGTVGVLAGGWGRVAEEAFGVPFRASWYGEG